MTEVNLIDAIADRIKFDMDKLAGVGLERIEVDSFNLSEFWTQFESAVQSLSNEVSKINFLCGIEPYPSEAEVCEMLHGVLPYYNMMIELYLVLPEEVGAEVFKATTTAVLNIITALFNIVNSFKDLTEKGSKERLSLTGTFWDACTAVGTLPKNNLLATLNIFEEESALATDALDELKLVNKNLDIKLECGRSKESCKDNLKEGENKEKVPLIPDTNKNFKIEFTSTQNDKSCSSQEPSVFTNRIFPTQSETNFQSSWWNNGSMSQHVTQIMSCLAPTTQTQAQSSQDTIHLTPQPVVQPTQQPMKQHTPQPPTKSTPQGNRKRKNTLSLEQIFAQYFSRRNLIRPLLGVDTYYSYNFAGPNNYNFPGPSNYNFPGPSNYNLPRPNNYDLSRYYNYNLQGGRFKR